MIEVSVECEKQEIPILERTKREKMCKPGYGVRRMTRKETTGVKTKDIRE